MKADDRETPYWIANFLAGIGMVACLMAFASSFPDGESQSPGVTAVDDDPGVASCVEQVQILTCATLEEISVRARQSGCASEILGQAKYLHSYVEETLNSLPMRARRAALHRLRSKIMEERFGKVISEMDRRMAGASLDERRPLESALDVLRRLARRFESDTPQVAAVDEAVSAPRAD